MDDHKIELALTFLKAQPGSAAAVLEQYPVEQVAEFLKGVPYAHAAAVLGRMLPHYTARICHNLDPAVSASFLSAMDVSQVAAIMRHTDKGQNRKLLELLPERMKLACKLLLNYSVGAVGAWMVANITTLPDDCTVEEALARLAAEHAVVASDVVHIIDRDRKLRGLVSLVDLLRTSANTPISHIIKQKGAAISGRTPLVSAAKQAIWAHGDTVVITNRNNQMVGVLRHIDLRRGLDELSSNLTSTLARSSGNDPLTGICEVYGSSLLALFGTISETASATGS